MEEEMEGTESMDSGEESENELYITANNTMADVSRMEHDASPQPTEQPTIYHSPVPIDMLSPHGSLYNENSQDTQDSQGSDVESEDSDESQGDRTPTRDLEEKGPLSSNKGEQPGSPAYSDGENLGQSSQDEPDADGADGPQSPSQDELDDFIAASPTQEPCTPEGSPSPEQDEESDADEGEHTDGDEKTQPKSPHSPPSPDSPLSPHSPRFPQSPGEAQDSPPGSPLGLTEGLDPIHMDAKSTRSESVKQDKFSDSNNANTTEHITFREPSKNCRSHSTKDDNVQSVNTCKPEKSDSKFKQKSKSTDLSKTGLGEDQVELDYDEDDVDDAAKKPADDEVVVYKPDVH